MTAARVVNVNETSRTNNRFTKTEFQHGARNYQQRLWSQGRRRFIIIIIIIIKSIPCHCVNKQTKCRRVIGLWHITPAEYVWLLAVQKSQNIMPCDEREIYREQVSK